MRMLHVSFIAGFWVARDHSIPQCAQVLGYGRTREQAIEHFMRAFHKLLREDNVAPVTITDPS
jgi:hypothetical protein